MEGFILGCEPRIQSTRSAIAVFSIALLCSACASSPDSGWTPFQAALFNPVQIYSEDTNVYGLRLGLPYGTSADVYGIDFGVAGSAKQVTGIEAGMINTVDEQVKGVQLAMIVNEAGELKGVQLAGIHNKSESVVGLQITSLVNETENLRGVQIGVLNFNRNGLIPIFLGINIGFGSSSEEATASDE